MVLFSHNHQGIWLLHRPGRQHIEPWQEDGLRLTDGTAENSFEEPPLRLNERAEDLADLVPAGISMQQVTNQAIVSSAGGAFFFAPFGTLVTVPEEAFAEQVTISLGPATSPPVSGLNSAFTLSIAAVANGNEVIGAKPVLMAFDVGAAHISPASFIGRYDAIAGTWDVPAMQQHGAGLISITLTESGLWAAVNFGTQPARTEASPRDAVALALSMAGTHGSSL